MAYPSHHGGRPEDAFDLVIPALPGFGFSGKPATPIGARTTARLFDRLMRGVLGYERYLAQGGDWGAGVSAWLGLDHASAVRGIHLNYLLVQPDAEPESMVEREWKAAFAERERRVGAYSALHSTKPLSLGYAMADNPVAQLAWLVERFHDWSDLRGRPFAEVFSKDKLLTNAMLYLATDAFATATWFYAGAVAEEVRRMPQGRRVEVPTHLPPTPTPARQRRRASGCSAATISRAGATCRAAAISPRWRHPTSSWPTCASGRPSFASPSHVPSGFERQPSNPIAISWLEPRFNCEKAQPCPVTTSTPTMAPTARPANRWN